MSESPEWFARKRYGWGATPVSWQGWAITIGFIAIGIGAARFFADRPIVVAAIVAPAMIVLLVITAKTTRGGWRWRWGSED